jgi:hypothetical protein
MPIAGQEDLLLFGFESRIDIGNHLTRNTLIFDVRVAIREAAALLPQLLGSHFDIASAIHKFLKLFGHDIP